jgi:dTDP-glucose pyrophosphorylase
MIKKMENFSKYLIKNNSTIKSALKSLSNVGHDTILFVVNEKNQLLGSITDGDIRRGLLSGLKINNNFNDAINKTTKYIRKNNYSINQIVEFRSQNITVFPLLDKNDVIIDIINLREKQSYLPLDVVIMAGGKGLRLKPLTDDLPKPLLKIKNKCIIDYNVDRLIDYGVENFFISVNYLGNLVEKHFDNRKDINISTKFIHESKPLGTVGAVSKIKEFKNEYVLITNSDIITNINYEDFLIDFIKKDADMSVVSIPYEIEVPYAVMKTENDLIKSFEEKPTYTYFSNGGIYLVKKHILDKIPKNRFYNMTQLMQEVLNDNLKLINYSSKDYWIDIGKHRDFKKAQKDMDLIKF